jgi:hypothetical protein
VDREFGDAGKNQKYCAGVVITETVDSSVDSPDHGRTLLKDRIRQATFDILAGENSDER